MPRAALILVRICVLLALNALGALAADAQAGACLCAAPASDTQRLVRPA